MAHFLYRWTDLIVAVFLVTVTAVLAVSVNVLWLAHQGVWSETIAWAITGAAVVWASLGAYWNR